MNLERIIDYNELAFIEHFKYSPEYIEPSKQDLFRLKADIQNLFECFKRLNIPMNEFQSSEGRIISQKPVIVSLRKGDELWFAENETLCIYATGITIDEAIEEFNQVIVFSFLHYKNIDCSKITGYAKRLKSIYEKEFMVNNGKENK